MCFAILSHNSGMIYQKFYWQFLQTHIMQNLIDNVKYE